MAPWYYDVTHENWMRGKGVAEITGEWIIYARHEKLNYHLCLGTHEKEYHNDLRSQINAVCCNEFPFLESFLDNS